MIRVRSIVCDRNKLPSVDTTEGSWFIPIPR